MGILLSSGYLLSFLSPETPRPLGLNTSHPILNVYLDRFFRSPKACILGRALFIATFLRDLIAPRSPGSGCRHGLIPRLARSEVLVEGSKRGPIYQSPKQRPHLFLSLHLQD